MDFVSGTPIKWEHPQISESSNFGVEAFEKSLKLRKSPDLPRHFQEMEHSCRLDSQRIWDYFLASIRIPKSHDSEVWRFEVQPASNSCPRWLRHFCCHLCHECQSSRGDWCQTRNMKQPGRIILHARTQWWASLDTACLQCVDIISGSMTCCL